MKETDGKEAASSSMLGTSIRENCPDIKKKGVADSMIKVENSSPFFSCSRPTRELTITKVFIAAPWANSFTLSQTLVPKGFRQRVKGHSFTNPQKKSAYLK